MADEFLVQPKPAPPLNIPESNNTVKLSCIDSTSQFRIPMGPFLQPEYVGHADMKGPALVFLIEHPSHKAVLFDLGIRKDWQVLPSYDKWVELGWYIAVEEGLAEILQQNKVDVAGGAVESIILSHHHWDHVGDCSTFPSSTEVVVGPGFVDAHLPGFPTNPDSSLLDTDFAGRELREVSFEDSKLRIGRFRTVDFFGDGSFYLLDTPGHSIGHICGLARTTASPPTFVFMGGDAAHHGGEFRPTPYSPLPREIKPSPLVRRPQVCPGELLRAAHGHGVADRPFYYVTESFAHDKAMADWTLDGLGEFDAHENVLMLMAHDDAAVDPPQLDYFPAQMNDWSEKGVGKVLKWRFLADFEEAAEARGRGELPFAWAEQKT